MFVIAAIALNPIIPLHLKHDTWAVIDIAATVFLLLSIAVFDIWKPLP